MKRLWRSSRPGHVAWPFDDMSRLTHSQHAKCSWTMALQTFLSVFFLLPTRQNSSLAVCFPGSLLAWRGTSGCSINITSGPRRHMTPKWAFQRRVDGILRFAMSPTKPAAPQKASQTQHTAAASKRCTCAVRRDTSTMAASRQAADKGPFLGQSLLRWLAGNSCTSLGFSGSPAVQARCVIPARLVFMLLAANARTPPSWWNGRPLAG
ncbi:hypothetical protein J3F84DRAFT_101716 [Trichoderma pleuroticola]